MASYSSAHLYWCWVGFFFQTECTLSFLKIVFIEWWLDYASWCLRLIVSCLFYLNFLTLHVWNKISCMFSLFFFFFNIYHKGTINTGSVWGFITELPSFSLFQPLELKHFFKQVASLNKPCGQLIMTEFFFNIQLPLIIWVQCYLLERLASSFQIPTNWLNLKLHLNAQTNETKINNCFFFVIFY